MINLVKRLETQSVSRVVGFGSSNTECCYKHDLIAGWLSWLDFSLRRLYGRKFTTINSGVSGQTSTQLLSRFDDSVRMFKPHCVFLTIGGNDSNPKNKMTLKTYRENILKIIELVGEIPDAEILVQSYYAPIYESLEQDYVLKFKAFMAEAILVAKEKNVAFIDHLPEWENLKEQIGSNEYLKLFDDPMHLNGLGNKLWSYRMLMQFVPQSHLEQLSEYYLDIFYYSELMNRKG